MPFQPIRFWFPPLFALAAIALSGQALAVVIDDFSVGDIVVDGPAVFDQTGLDPAHVIGGARRIDVGRHGEGSRFEVADDQLKFSSTGRGYMTLTYGAVEPLGELDLTEGGHDRFRLRFGEVSSSYVPMGLYVNLGPWASSNGVGWTVNTAWEGLIVEIPYSSFPVLFTAVQTIALDALRNPSDSGFEIESLVTAGPSLPGDFNRDGNANGDDLAVWSQYFGLPIGWSSPKVVATSDANADGRVDGADFLIWQRSLGVPVPEALPVPEPAAGALVAGIIVLAYRRHGRRH